MACVGKSGTACEWRLERPDARRVRSGVDCDRKACPAVGGSCVTVCIPCSTVSMMERKMKTYTIRHMSNAVGWNTGGPGFGSTSPESKREGAGTSSGKPKCEALASSKEGENTSSKEGGDVESKETCGKVIGVAMWRAKAEGPMMRLMTIRDESARVA